MILKHKFKFRKFAAKPYNTGAFLTSKLVIACFFIVFFYLAIFSDVKPGFFWGIAFLFVGMFISSIMAFPFYFMEYQFPKLKYIFFIANLTVIVYVTMFAYFSAFDVDPTEGLALKIFCEEPLPEFTLKEDSNPNAEQIKTLCNCIWQTLPQKHKQTWQMWQEGNIKPNYFDKKWFALNFGDAVKACGGYEL